MRNLRSIIFISITLVLLLSCQKETEPSEIIPIRFNPIVTTKSYITSATDNEFRTNGFSVFANKTYGSESREIMENTKVWYQGNTWGYGNLISWGLDCDHNFLAIYPWKTDTHPSRFDKVAGVYNSGEINTVDAAGKCIGEDIMYGRHQQHYKLGDKPLPVALQMEHALTAITLKIRNATPYTIEKISNAQLSGLRTKATNMSIKRIAASEQAKKPTFVLDESSTANTYMFDTSNLGQISTQFIELAPTFIVLPQEFFNLNPTLHFEVKNKEENEIKLKDINLSQVKLNNGDASLNHTFVDGKHYIYNININDNNITCDVKIVSWRESDIIELK